MKKFNVAILLMAVLVLVGGVTVFMLSQISNDVEKKDKVHLVIKTLSESTDFWSNVVKGAEVAATELGVEVVVHGPVSEIYVTEQIDIIRNIIKEKPEALAIAASDYDALAEVCQAAVDADITFVTFDSDVNIESEHSFIATNNYSAGQRIAHEMATLIEGDGTVGMISHVEGAFTAFERIEGFKQGMKHFDPIEIIDHVYYTDNSQEIAYDAAIEMMTHVKNLKGIYATNEVTLLGAGQAVKDLDMENEIVVVGFDMNKEIALLIEQDVIDATMVQKPFNMGYLAVKEALEVMAGKEPQSIDTGAVMINKDNMFLPENQKLIVPNVD